MIDRKSIDCKSSFVLDMRHLIPLPTVLRVSFIGFIPKAVHRQKVMRIEKMEYGNHIIYQHQ